MDMSMNMDDIELKLLAGMPIEIEGAGKLYSPKLKDVTQLGESKYNQYLSILLFDKNNIEENINDDLSNFDIVFYQCYHNEEFKNAYLSALNFIFKKKVQMCDVTKSTDAFFIFEDNGIVNKDNFSLIQDIVRIGNHVKVEKKEEDTYNPADEITAKIIAEMLERKRKKTKAKANHKFT